jgi:hypothetical protein
MQKYTPDQRLQKFLSQINISENGCWEWQGSYVTNRNGAKYGTFWNGKTLQLSHRFSYEYFIGPIPPGKEMDHLCRNTICCNPDHVEPVTHLENMQRGINKTKVTCSHGHPFSVENTRIGQKGRRYCHACHVIRERERKRAIQKKTQRGTPLP